tara:strand:- start:47 stop:352 length:306 start_codon:yes stop_codon:yes gene_type:complete
MIDTDKYEGHLTDLKGLAETIEQHRATYALLRDAPLLLAEVKRLRRAFRIATAHIGFGNHLGHAELRRALNSVGIDYNSLPWADGEWEEPLPTFGGVAHYD